MDVRLLCITTLCKCIYVSYQSFLVVINEQTGYLSRYTKVESFRSHLLQTFTNDLCINVPKISCQYFVWVTCHGSYSYVQLSTSCFCIKVASQIEHV